MKPDDLREPVRECDVDGLCVLYRAVLSAIAINIPNPKPPPKPARPAWLRPEGCSVITRADEDWARAGREIH